MYELKLHRVWIFSYQSLPMAQGMLNLFITLHPPSQLTIRRRR
jgi:hypothetical protein